MIKVISMKYIFNASFLEFKKIVNIITSQLSNVQQILQNFNAKLNDIYNYLQLYSKDCLQNIEMITNSKGSIQLQQTQALLQLLTQKQESVTKSLLSKHKSAEETAEIQQFIEIMRKLQQIQQNNIEKSLSKIQKKGLYAYLKVLFSSYFYFHSKINYQALTNLFLYGLAKILSQKSLFKWLNRTQMEKWKYFICYRKHQIKQNQSTEQQKYIIEKADKYIQEQTPKLIKFFNSMVGLLIQRFQRQIQNSHANESLKNFMAQQIQILKRFIQRSVIKEQQLRQIAGCQRIKYRIIYEQPQIRTKQFYQWQRSSKKVQILQECIDFAVVLSVQVKKIKIQYLSKEQNIILKLILPKQTEITYLCLKSCQLGNEIIEFIKKLIHLKNLQLPDNHIDNKGMKQISQINFYKIKSLNMDSNPITNKGLYYLAKANWYHINTISMKNCPTTASGFKIILKLMRLQFFSLSQGRLNFQKECIRFIKSLGGKYFLSLTSKQLQKI